MKTFLQFTEETLKESFEIHDASGSRAKKIATVRSNRDLDDWMHDNEGKYARIIVRRNDGNTVTYDSTSKGWTVVSKAKDIGKLEESRGSRQPGLSSSGYVLYHNTYSAAVQHALEFVEKKHGLVVDEDDYFTKVTTGPKKPSRGKTNSFNIELVDARTGNPSRKRLHMQVYNNDNKNYELNMYVS